MPNEEGLKLRVDQLDDLGIGLDAQILKDGLEERRRIKLAMDSLSQEMSDLNAMLLGVMVSRDIQVVSGPGGTISHKRGVNRSINRDKITNTMLSEGIDADMINRILEDGTTVSAYETVEFRLPRRVKGE
jgi:hypothetical protein